MPGHYPPSQWWRWKMARDTGWSLEYIDGLSMADWHEYWQVTDGEGKARETARNSARMAAQQARRGGKRRR